MTFNLFKRPAPIKVTDPKKENLTRELPSNAKTVELLRQMTRTSFLFDRLRKGGKIEYDEKGEPYYQGRRIIHHDSPIDGGVYLGSGEREAIVVDSTYSNSEIMRLYAKAKERATWDGRVHKSAILSSVFNIVTEAMPPNEKMVDAIIERNGVKNDGKIALDIFIKNKAGVCRHHALTCGVLLELFKKDGHIKGTPSVDRNSDDEGGHAWCRYTNSIGEVYILDVTHGVLKSLEEAYFGLKAKMIQWDYRRPTDKV